MALRLQACPQRVCLTCRNQRLYVSLVRTVDLRPPTILSTTVQPGFTTLNLTVTLSEPGSLAGLMYDADDVANVTLTVPASGTWPPSLQVGNQPISDFGVLHMAATVPAPVPCQPMIMF